MLDLHGQTLFVDEAGHWVKFIVARAAAAPQRPHGLSRSLTLHAPDGERLAGFDSAHPVRERRGPGMRRRRTNDHRLRSVGPYGHKDAAAPLKDFRKEADQALKERGSIA